MIAASVNSALGRAGLLLMLAASVVGALTVFVGIQRGDKRLLRQGARYAWMAFGGVVLAVVMMQRALITRDFSMAYIQQVGSADTPALYNIAAMWSALEGSILLWAVILGRYTAAVAWRFRKRTNDVLVGWALIVMYVIAAFFAALSFGPADPFGAGCRRRHRGAGAEPAAAEPHPGALSPADPLPRLRRIRRAVRIRHRRAGHRQARRRLVDGDPALGAVRLGVPHDRHPARRLVELRGARLVGRVGLGPGRERLAAAVAHRHGLHPLGARPGTPRDAARLEPEPARGHVLADDPRHVHHAVGGDQLGARVRRRARRFVAARPSSASPWSCRSA